MIKKIFSDNPEISSKRVVGGICFLFAIIMFAISYFIGKDFSDNQTTIFTAIIYTAGGLLGVGTFANLRNGNKT